MDGCLLLLHVITTYQIQLKFCIDVALNLESIIAIIDYRFKTISIGIH